MQRFGWLIGLAVGCGGDDGLPPAVSILAPQDGAVLTGGSVDLVALVSDSNDDLVSVEWHSSADGLLVADAFPDGGRSTALVELSVGTHAVSVEAMDGAGLSASDVVEITVVEGAAPSVSILSPQDGTVLEVGAAVALEGTTASGTFPPDQLSASWTVETSGASSEVSASGPSDAGQITGVWSVEDAGEYTLVLRVSDPAGLESVAEVEVTVVEDFDEDSDEDGVSITDGDCDDTDATVYPGAAEQCNGVDDDCDGEVDDVDRDADGVVDDACTTYVGELPTGDCDDTEAAVFPGNPEVVDGLDNDCNGLVDDGSFGFDSDGDCYCPAEVGTVCTGSVNDACVTVEPGDCDDASDSVNPGAQEVDGYTLQGEVYTAVDEDCDGSINEGFASFDNDGDCYCEDEAVCFGTSGECPASPVLPGDCDDFGPDAALRHPGRAEVEDGIDNNCDADGYIDEGTPAFDDDGDCYCASETACADGVDASCVFLRPGDCDELDSDVNPGAVDEPEVAAPFADTNCDGVDGNISESVFAAPGGTGAVCTPTAPCALSTAIVQPADYVLLAEGEYTSPGVVTGNPVVIGGYSADFSGRSTDPTSTRLWRAVSPVLTIASGADVTLSIVEVGAPTTGPRRDRRTVVIDGGQLTLSEVRIERGEGEDANRGFSGVSASSSRAPRGNDALGESEIATYTNRSGPTNPACPSPQVRGGSGGYRGSGTITGGPGLTPQGEIASRGGAPNRGTPSPSAGADGSTVHGSGGEGGRAPTAGTRTGFTGGGATDGSLGLDGWGGSGGGGTGGARINTIDLRQGATGASGGTGGCMAPTPGFGAGSGGASVGVWNYAGTLVQAGSVRIADGVGGNGGEGGAPGMGQPGGLGGNGSSGSDYAWPSGDGGDGGQGGNSGGGGGGRGGSVYGIVLVGGGTLSGAGTLDVENGVPGEGGLGGGQDTRNDTRFPWLGAPGVDGESADTLELP